MAEGVCIPRAAYTVAEVAQSLGVTARFVWELVATHQINSFKLGRRRLIPAAELERITTEGMGGRP